MKKILSFMATALLALAFVSCSSDDDKELDLSTNSIVGNWKTYTVKYTEYKNGSITEEETSYFDEDYYMLWSFKADGTFVDITVEDGDTEQYKGTWLVSADKLYMNYRDVEMGYEWTDTYTISSSTASKFVILEKYSETEGSITWEEVSEFTFIKQ